MTTEALTVLPNYGEDSQSSSRARAAACAFCRKRLADEYFFTCLKCDASYCYIHMARHHSAKCARQVNKRQPVHLKPATEGQGEDVAPERGAAVLVAGHTAN